MASCVGGVRGEEDVMMMLGFRRKASITTARTQAAEDGALGDNDKENMDINAGDAMEESSDDE